jgi:DNA-binding MarR family transcriptional regulator
MCSMNGSTPSRKSLRGVRATDGLIERHPDPGDKRRILIELTDEGREALEQDRRNREGWLARGIAESVSPEEQATLARAVELLERLTRG